MLRVDFVFQVYCSYHTLVRSDAVGLDPLVAYSSIRIQAIVLNRLVGECCRSSNVAGARCVPLHKE